MPRELRRRGTMDNTELAPIADTRETEAEEIGPTHRPLESEDDGIDDGFGPAPPTNGVPRRSPYPGTFTPTGKRPLDVNLYATKKTVAQGMMDLALLTANANQLRYVLESGKYGNPTANYYISLTLIGFSIAMQLMIGVALIFLGRYNVSREHHAQKADKLNNWVVLGVFIITVINVFISSFSIEPFHGVDPVLLRSVAEGKVPAPDVTEKISNINGL
ncbi:ninjurin-2-like isoform X2 [Portunus trituberculatus]|uniref:ninjurin-2-like isoform X2 n=1 Tax=Portunus trituberculatus TaxID=210409 RepID=UPI001E1D2185|nr:ninjurin-2-like isoform X2 [Portunus trituberculatus]XP_045138557.1 ninjurin-2-like isoform X2 [Portunus trituberculatus]